MQLILLKGLLLKNIYNKYQGRIPDNLFEDHIGVVYKTLVKVKNELDCSLGINDLKLLFFVNNPALTIAQKDVFEVLFSRLQEVETPNEEAVDAVFRKLILQERVRKIASEAVDFINGQDMAYEQFRTSITSFIDCQDILANDDSTTIQEVNYDIDELIRYGANQGEFKINVPGLREFLPGLDRATLTAVFARPETGKTASWITLVAGPNGFLSQGLKCVVVGNEEPVIRSQLRCVNACSGVTLDAMLQDAGALEHARKAYTSIKPNLKLYDAVGLSMGDLNALARKEKPDIMVVDTLDKISIGGSFARDDLRIKELYVQARELSKRNSLALIATSQASAEAEDRKVLTLDMMENSRTGKAAECDVIIGIGKYLQGELNTPIRHMYLCKNKLTGIHDIANVTLHHKLSLYAA